MRIRVLATDLDGTLLRSDGSVSDRTRRALAAAEESGVEVVFVTARPPRSVTHLADVVGGHGTVVCANGAAVVDVSSGRVLALDPLPRPVLLEAIGVLRRTRPRMRFAIETAWGFAAEEGHRQSSPWPVGTAPGPIDDRLTDDVLKVLAYEEGSAAEDLVAHAAEVLGDRVTATNSGTRSKVEMSAPGVSKASALRRFCAERQVPVERVIAVGDMLNDLPMLGWAGTSYAVANAHPAVLAAVDRVTASNDEDGVALILEGLVAGSGD